MLWLHFCCN